MMMMIELEPDYISYKDMEKEFEKCGYELIGIKYINLEPIYLIRKIK